MISTDIQNFCKTDYEYLIVFLKFIDFFEFILLDENNRCSEDCIKSIDYLIEETFKEESTQLLKYRTYFKRFCLVAEEFSFNEVLSYE